MKKLTVLLLFVVCYSLLQTAQARGPRDAKESFSKKVNLAQILSDNQVVLVDFNATWCGPCRMMKPTIKQLEKDYAGKAKVVAIDTDYNSDLVAKYNIRSIPAFLLFKNGKLVWKTAGYTNKKTLKQAIDKQL